METTPNGQSALAKSNTTISSAPKSTKTNPKIEFYKSLFETLAYTTRNVGTAGAFTFLTGLIIEPILWASREQKNSPQYQAHSELIREYNKCISTTNTTSSESNSSDDNKKDALQQCYQKYEESLEALSQINN